MTTQSLALSENMECPLCLGKGKLKRTEVLDRLGVKDFARVAQLSAEEALRLLQQKHTHDHRDAWARFESELTRRTAEIEQRHRDELQTLGGRLKEFESAARVADERKALDVQQVRAELETKLRSGESQREGLLFENTQIVETEIWRTLFEFQKDAVKGAINKINAHNGCIIADSVGLGKTFEALAIIKYYELRNNRVLVLCPKKVRENWTIYQAQNNSDHHQHQRVGS
jgi:SNF2 family DNA or RNA helicase